MSVHLQRIRLFATTKNEFEAGTDSGVELRFWVNRGSATPWPRGWNASVLEHSWNDRARGRTEMYEVDFTSRDDVGVAVAGRPAGLAYANFAEARSASFILRMRGSDWWKIDHYYLLGKIMESQFVPGTIDTFRTIDRGWLLMARHDDDVEMSTDPTEGVRSHFIELNGTF